MNIWSKKIKQSIHIFVIVCTWFVDVVYSLIVLIGDIIYPWMIVCPLDELGKGS